MNSEPTAGAPPAPLTVLAADEHLFRSTVRQFADERVRPHVAAMEREARLAPEIVRQLFELGLMAIGLPESDGGAGGSFFMSILAVEELSRVDASVGVLVDVQNTLVNRALLRWGTREQRATLAPRLARDTLGAYALSEAGSGSDAFALATRAAPVAGGFVLDGRKLWVTNAADAGLFIVFANANPAAGHRGITAFLVDRGTPGLDLGRKEDKLGLRASSTCELILERCFVPSERVLGPVGGGYKVAIETLNEGRIGIGAQMVGVAHGALHAAIDYARARKQFGRPIAEFQAVQFELAALATDLESARLMVYNAARLRDAGHPYLKEAAMAKYHASAMAERVTSRSLEIFGGYGYTTDFPAEKYYRDAKIGKIYEGTSNMQLLTIAKQIL